MSATATPARLVSRKVSYLAESTRTFTILGIEREGVNKQGEKFATFRVVDHDSENAECFKTLHLSKITIL